MTSITLRIPVDVVESLKTTTPQRGFTGCQTLLDAYLSEGLRSDEAQFFAASQARLIEALNRCGVAADLTGAAERDCLQPDLC